MADPSGMKLGEPLTPMGEALISDFHADVRKSMARCWVERQLK
jgi:hypothetical protein